MLPGGGEPLVWLPYGHRAAPPSTPRADHWAARTCWDCHISYTDAIYLLIWHSIIKIVYNSYLIHITFVGIPSCALCNNGHGFCISCSLQSHSPCTCSQMQLWLQQVTLLLSKLLTVYIFDYLNIIRLMKKQRQWAGWSTKWSYLYILLLFVC